MFGYLPSRRYSLGTQNSYYLICFNDGLLTFHQIFHPFGITFITAGARGDFREWQVVGLDDTSCDPIHVEKKQSRFLKKMRNDSQIGMFYDLLNSRQKKIS